jgi:hypothetical protein
MEYAIDRFPGDQCDICGRRYRENFSIPDEVWELIGPLGMRKEGYLCLSCADYRARKCGIVLEWRASVRTKKGVIDYDQQRTCGAGMG